MGSWYTRCGERARAGGLHIDSRVAGTRCCGRALFLAGRTHHAVGSILVADVPEFRLGDDVGASALAYIASITAIQRRDVSGVAMLTNFLSALPSFAPNFTNR